MSFRDDLLPVVDDARGIATDLGLRQHSVTIRTETFPDEAHIGTSPTVSDLTLSPRPKVRESSSGRKLKVGPITPSHSGGGYTAAQLNPLPDLSANQRVIYRVTGPNGTRDYMLSDITTDRGYRHMLELTSLDRDGPR